jgi:PAS domain S-box-containing protein
MKNANSKDIADALILIVDDSVDRLVFLTRLLGKLGCRVAQANSGRKALEMAASTPPDLILLDIQMPGIDGFEVCKRLKQNSQLNHIPVIFLSGLSDLDAKMHAFQIGGVDFIDIPFHSEEILVRVKTHLQLVRVEHLEREIEIRKRAESEIRRLNDTLENLVRQRTSELINLHDESRKFHRVIEHSPITVVITNRAGEIEYVNPKFTETTGYSTEEALGKTPRILNAQLQPKSFYRQMWEVIKGGGVWHGEFCNRKKNGEMFWESSAIFPIRNDQGAITHYVAVKEDITALKKAADEMKKAKESAEIANKAKSFFLANMSHEIRTPLNAILGYTQILQGDSQLTDSQKKVVGIISRSGEHLLALINDILEMSKIEAGQKTLQPKVFDVQALIRDLELMFQVRTKTKGISLDVELDSNVPRHIYADEGKLRQVIINILGNAVKFTDQGGIAVRMETVEKEEKGFCLKIEIEDTGTGIPEDELDRIFNPFEQGTNSSTLREGTGLGLTISRQFVRLMGGELTVKSQLGIGSTFSMFIPVKEVEAPPTQVQRKERKNVGMAPGLKPWRILVVDDLDLNRLMLVTMLTRIGFSVKEACNGAEAVELFKSWQPHLILMDLQMPVMDGCTAMRTIHSLNVDPTPIFIAVTACGFEQNRQEAQEAGACDFLLKPFKEIELFEKISAHLKLKCVANNEPVENRAESPDSGSELGTEDVLSLPRAWVAGMQEALIDGDIFAVNELIGDIRNSFPNTSELVRKLADNYEYEKITRFLKP